MTWLQISAFFTLISPGVAGAQGQQSVARSPNVVFDQVTVVDVEHGKLRPGQRVVIEGNRIRAVGGVGAVKIPQGAQVVDARGKYLLPGLWDMHVHPMRYTDSDYPLFIANGVTGIRDAGSSVPLDTLQLWRHEILSGTRVGPPRQILSGQSIGGPEAACQRAATRGLPQTCVKDSADAVHYVDSLKAAGADMIKPRAVSREMWFVIAREARRMGIPFGGHAAYVTPREASDSGARTIDHAQQPMGDSSVFGLCWDGIWIGKNSANVEKCRAVAVRFKRNGTWFLPTFTAYLANTSDLVLHAAGVVERLAKQAQAFEEDSVVQGNWLHDSTKSSSAPGEGGGLRIMERVGLPLLAGTDVFGGPLTSFPPGFTLHAELAVLAAEGMSAAEILRTATLNPALSLHATDSLGTVAPGKLADLVLLDADPLADVTNTTTIRAVVANGRYFDRAALDQLLADARANADGNRRRRRSAAG